MIKKKTRLNNSLVFNTLKSPMHLNKMKFANYNHKQELWNSITHLIGVVFSIAITIVFVVLTAQRNLSFKYTYPFYIYTFTMFVVFFVSTFYHSMPLNSKIRAISRVIDHLDIFLFVAGTYTPLCILGISNYPISLGVLIVEWVLAAIGIVLTLIGFNHKSVQIISYIIYLLAGWALIFVYPFNQCLPLTIFLFTLAGGIVYSIGAILYAVGKKYIWCHTIFHIFILGGAILQFIGVLYLLFI